MNTTIDNRVVYRQAVNLGGHLHRQRERTARAISPIRVQPSSRYRAAPSSVADNFSQAIELLIPAEAATHMPHPNLWSWRALLTDGRPDSVFMAFFLADLDDPPLGPDDELFRDLLGADTGHR